MRQTLALICLGYVRRRGLLRCICPRQIPDLLGGCSFHKNDIKEALGQGHQRKMQLFYLRFSFHWFFGRGGRERGRERERDHALFHRFMHSLVDSCMCPDWGSNLQAGRIKTTLSPTELPGQGSPVLFLNLLDSLFVTVIRSCLCGG